MNNLLIEILSLDNLDDYYFNSGCNSNVYLYKGIIIKELHDYDYDNQCDYDIEYFNFLDMYKLFPNNIPKIYNYENDKIFMEYIEGETLFDLIDKEKLNIYILNKLFDLTINLALNNVYVSDLHSKNLVYDFNKENFYIVDIEDLELNANEFYLPSFFEEFENLSLTKYFLNYLDSKNINLPNIKL